MPAVVGAMWAVLIVVSRRRPPGAARQRLLAARPAMAGSSVSARSSFDLFGAIGSAVLRVGRRPGSALLARQLGAALVLGIAIAAVMPVASPVGAAAGWFVPVAVARAAERRRLSAFAVALADVVDLLALAVGAGLTVSLAVAAVARRVSGPFAVELSRVCEDVALGRRMADALDDLPERCGEAVRPLVAALVASERYGAPLGPGLERLAREVRRDRRRVADEAVRRVPVKLLFPLVTCTLPAFALLTVAPLLASAVRSLRL